MFTIVLIGLGMTVAARHWKVMVQRELEADLISKGIEIQNALAFYSATMKAGRVVPGEVYPQTLAELTRLPKPFLRKVYAEPLGHGDWELVRAPTGGIMGVRSKSKGKPIWQHNFPPAVRHFDGRKSYYDWVFQHPNPSMAFVGMAGTGAVVPGPAGEEGASPGTSPMTRVLDDYEQMVSESGDYFETCGELTIAVEDHETFARWFDAMRPWCRGTRALDGLIWQLCEGDWSAK